MPENIKEILQLRGLNLRQEPADIEEPESRKLVNLDPFQEPGTLVIRRGKEILGGPLFDDLVRAVARVNSVRYQVAGRRLYREFVPITTPLAQGSQSSLDHALVATDGTTLSPLLAANEKTSFAAFRPLDDSVTWAFIADDDWMLKDDGTRLYQWGIGEPLDPAPKLANQTGKDPGGTITTGAYKIAVTQLRYDHTKDT